MAASLFPGWGGDQLPASSKRCCIYTCACWYDLYSTSVRRVLRCALACSPYADAAYPPVRIPVPGTKAGTACYRAHLQQVRGVIHTQHLLCWMKLLVCHAVASKSAAAQVLHACANALLARLPSLASHLHIYISIPSPLAAPLFSFSSPSIILLCSPSSPSYSVVLVLPTPCCWSSRPCKSTLSFSYPC